MKTWENFEEQCTNFLNKKFGTYAKFVCKGGADSTVPDILVETNSGSLFYIEVKHSPAQCGQFVLLPDLKTKTFEYSSLNGNPINQYSKMIKNYMDNNFSEFVTAGTTGKSIDMPNGSDIFSNWIIQIYKEKGVRFFITNDNIIFPIDRFKEYFEVTAKYRIKRSGSSNVGKRDMNEVIEYISTHGYAITSHYIFKNKLFVVSEQKLHDHRFTVCGREYMFSLRTKEYEIRKLSKTYNANVIFSIRIKSIIKGLSEEEFIDYLK
ncbi:hypothetical protein P9079_11130 [Gallibacterium anatis]|uniref:hypothetical protein n=1 Tax=Gallibacterium anatis TaxID=750 RepID=UPI003003E38B